MYLLQTAAIQIPTPATDMQMWGAFAFGVVIGWFIYFTNRYRKAADVQISDLGSLVGAVGGGAILALFPAGTDLFAGYAIGLAVGFFAYFVVLIIIVLISPDFNLEWFLDGRRKSPRAGYGYPDATPSDPEQHPTKLVRHGRLSKATVGTPLKFCSPDDILQVV